MLIVGADAHIRPFQIIYLLIQEVVLMRSAGIYVHIPFCVKKCNYCDFNSYAGCFDRQEAYFDALFSEILKKSGELKDFVFDTVYIGGGTPTSVNSDYIEELMAVLRENYDISENAEITIECNPKTAGRQDFEKYKNAGINRLSIGLQSTDDRLLKMLGRIHSLSDFEKCLSDARSQGFENISADLMYALPTQSLSDWEKTLEKVIGYGLSHISCYALKIEEGTPFYDMNLTLPDDDLCADMYDTAMRMLEGAGFGRYEISNFARDKKESRHNLKYWSFEPYIGFGAGAYSSLELERYSNSFLIDDYILNAKKGYFEKCDVINLSKREAMSEFIFMGLRKTEGILKSDFQNLFGECIEDVFKKPLGKYLALGVLTEKNGRIYINENMLYISNSVLCDFV